MEQPPGFVDPLTPHFVCKLHKALYGLKQAPRAWFEKLHGTLLSLGFTAAKSDQYLFVKTTPQFSIYLLVYVDDILITGSDTQSVTTLIQSLNNTFALKDIGNISYFLGFRLGLYLMVISTYLNKNTSQTYCQEQICNLQRVLAHL